MPAALSAIGLMSGTSLDGVDAAWIETDGERVLAQGPHLTLAYDDALRADLRRLLDRAETLALEDPDLASATLRLTDYHARAVAALGRPADVIGFHGQTILHRPAERRTWQIGDAAALAKRCGGKVVHDFRLADVASGGEGAPFAPIFHAAMVGRGERPVAVLNIGGVANITFIGADGALLACDTGPGNGPLDDWTKRHTGQDYDRDGALARAGKADQAVLARLLAHPFFARPAPKSLDRLDFSAALATSGLDGLSAEDGAATLVAFTAAAVAGTQLPERPRRVLVTGGGRMNPAIMDALRTALAVPVVPVEDEGWDGDALEAQCFAHLAVRSLAGLPLSFPGTTGVPAPMTGGKGGTAMTERTRTLLRDGDATIDLVAEGEGTPIVLLASAGRDSLDFDDLAAALAREKFRVLRPQPRGAFGSTGPMEGITLHDLARDVAHVIEAEGRGSAFVAGHAFGQWIARTAAADRPDLVRGVLMIAAAAKQNPRELSDDVNACADPATPRTERLALLQKLFFAPGHDPEPWLEGWHPEARRCQRTASAATKQSDWWAGGTAPILELQARLDPFKPPEKWDELKDELGDRVTTVMIDGASHALIPERLDAVTRAMVDWMRTVG